MIRMTGFLPHNTQTQAATPTGTIPFGAIPSRECAPSIHIAPRISPLSQPTNLQRLRDVRAYATAGQPAEPSDKLAQQALDLPTERALEKVLDSLGQNTLFVNEGLRENLSKAESGQGFLIALSHGEIGFLPETDIKALKSLMKHQVLADANASSVVGQDAGCLLIKRGCSESEVRQQMYQYFGGNGFNQFWAEFSDTLPWEDGPKGSIVTTTSLVALSPALDYLSQQLIDKVNDNSLIGSLHEVYQFALESFVRGGMDEDTLELVRESVLSNMIDVFKLNAKEFKSRSADLDALGAYAQERFVLGSMSRMIEDYETTVGPLSDEQAPLLAGEAKLHSPVFAIEDLSYDWVSSELFSSFSVFDPSMNVHLANASSSEWTSFGIGQEHMPLMMMSPNTAEKEILTILQTMTGSLLGQDQQKACAASLMSKLKGSTQPKFESVARLRQDVLHMFWLKVVGDPEIKRVKRMTGLADNHFFSFPQEVRTALIANYGLVFHDKTREIFIDTGRPALVVSSDQLVNLSKRVMLGTMNSSGDSVATASAHLRKIIRDEYGEIPFVGYDAFDPPENTRPPEGPTDASYDGDTENYWP